MTGAKLPPVHKDAQGNEVFVLAGDAFGGAAASITDDVLSEMKEVLDLQRFYIESEKEPGENSDQIKLVRKNERSSFVRNTSNGREILETLITKGDSQMWGGHVVMPAETDSLYAVFAFS